MASGDEPDAQTQSKQYVGLRSDLSAALSAFDRAQDWADLIHDLQRVNRVFAKHANTTYLPEKQLLAKRLAQCLTSSLPSGVHLKALETYRIVFTRIGSARLARDLPLYAGGLFPLFSYSATSLKPALLSLYESQFLPLGPSLAPLVDGLVLAILPGLEDESSDFYERSVALLDSIAAAMMDAVGFCRALWRALLLSPPMRLPAANYIRSRITSDSKVPWAGRLLDDMPLVSHAMAAALNDRNALVQRSVLDLLLGELALDLPFFKVHSGDCQAAAVALVGGVFGALLRRDMSLTKRVHSWFLGGNSGDRAIRYCNDYSRRWLLGAIDCETNRALIASTKESANVGAATRPCKVIAGLLDRDEIAVSISADLAIRILKFARAVLKSPDNSFEREVQHAVVEVVAQLGSSTIFRELEQFVVDKTSAENGEQDKYELLSFALLFAPVREAGVRRKQLPGLLRVAVDALDHVPDQPQVLKSAVSFCGAAMEAMEFSTIRGEEATAAWEVMPSIAGAFISFFMAWLATAVRSAPLEIRRSYADITVEDEISAEFETASIRDVNDDLATVAQAACQFLTKLIMSRVCGPETATCAMQAAAKCALAGDMRVSLAGARAYAEIAANSNQNEAKCSAGEQTSGVVRKTWRLLHPSLPTATASNAQVWLLLQRQFPEHVNVVVADGMLSPIPVRRLRNLERFACVWRLAVEHRLHPVPADSGLFLMLDALDDRDWAPKMLARSWLSEALAADAGAVLDAPLRLLLTPETCSRGANHEFAGVYDAPRALYAFQVLRSIVESAMLGAGASNDSQSDTRGSTAGEQGMGGNSSQSKLSGSFMTPKDGRSGAHALVSATPSARTLATLAAVFGPKRTGREDIAGGVEEGPITLTGLLPALDYLSVLTVTTLGFLRGRVPERFSALERHPMYSVLHGGTKPQAIEQKAGSPATADDSSLSDEVEWLAAGLGFKPYSQLHSSVAVAAAEFLAKLMSCLPSHSRSCGLLAEQIADPLLSLLVESVKERDSVLQLHYLEAILEIVVAEGHGFPLPATAKRSSFAFEGTLEQVDSSSSLTTSPTHGMMSISQQRVRQQEAGYIESHPLFVPWMLCGLSQACKAPADGRDVGSQEVLSLRRKWIRFVTAMAKHVGASLPMVAEGTILTLCKLLEDRYVQCKLEESGESSVILNESEFSRIDERLLLLKALALISATSSTSFEFALSHHILCDESGLPNAVDPGSMVGGMQNMSARKRSTSNGSLPAHNGVAGNSIGVEREKNTPDVITDPSKPLAAAGTTASAATMSMMNAINSPFRILNDFVKDVFTGSSSDGLAHLADPRRSAARALHMHLPLIIRAVAQTWGPQKESVNISDIRAATQRGHVNVNDQRERTSRILPMPRLSRELPRERRQAERDSALAVMEPLFASRPADVVASVVTLFCGPAPKSGKGRGTVQAMAVDMLQAVDLATPDVVVSCAAEILDSAMKWDPKSALAEDGKGQIERRVAMVNAVSAVVDNGPDGGMDGVLSLSGSGQGMAVTRSIFAGGKSSEEHGVTAIAQAIGTNFALPRPYPVGLFHAGDFFATHVAGDVETAVLRFLELYFESCRDSDDVQGAWSGLHLLSKEALSSHTRKASITALARVLAAYAGRHSIPHSDKWYRKELMTVASGVLNTCSSLASGTADFSAEVPAGASSRDIRSQHSVRALQALAASVSILIDSAFVDDKSQIVTTATAALSPAIATLRRTASKAASARRTSRATSPDMNAKDGHVRQRNAEEDLDDAAALAAADIILHIVKRDWGTRLARRELVGLLDDPNFFFGKHGDILSRLATVVSEAIASGGAAALLSSIGSTAPVTATGIPGLFTGRDSESVLRARAVRRVAFCVFVADPDHYHPQLPSVLERLRDSLRLAEPGLVVECLLCLRVLLLRTGPASIAAFRATTLSEMFRIASEPAKNLSETLATLQFLDLITLISPPDFGYVRCFFFSSEDEKSVEVDDGERLPVYRPLVPQLAALRTGSASDGTYPLRLEAGRTVYSGRMEDALSEDFIGHYAALLAARNRSPAMANATPDFHSIRGELELEFVQILPSLDP